MVIYTHKASADASEFERGGDYMTEKEQKILNTFAEIIPKLSDEDKERLLMFGEGMRFKVEQGKAG